MKQVRTPFIYLTIISIILGIIGIVMIEYQLTGNVVESENLKIYSLQEVQTHNTINDCYIILDNYVYDLSTAINLYSEFSELKDKCGTNSENSFSEFQDILDNYKIGKIS